MSVHGHTQYKSSGTCHLLGFLLVHTHVGEQLFPFSKHCFLLLVVILRRKRPVFSGAIQLKPEKTILHVHMFKPSMIYLNFITSKLII